MNEVIENKDFRFDSGFWTTILIKNNHIKYDKIGNVLLKSQYGISIAMNENSVGFPIYRMNEITNMLCDLQVSKYANITDNELEVFKLNDGDVLFNRTNSYEWVGRTGVYYKNASQDFIFASYLVRFVPNPLIVAPEYLSAFLNTKYGVRAIKARARQSINQTNVNPEEVKEIEIPLLGSGVQENIVICFKEANKLRILSETLYTEAQNFLLDELGLLNYAPTNKAVSIKSFTDSFGTSGRLDAEYYQPKYEDIEERISTYKHGFSLVSDMFSQNKEIYKSEADEHNYIEIGDVDVSSGIALFSKVAKDELPANAKINLNKSDIIYSTVRPYRGAVAICEFDKSIVVSGAFTVLHEKGSYLKETLLVILRSNVYKEYIMKYNVGSSYPVVRDENILNLKIPNLTQDIQIKIAKKIQQSFSLRKQSTILLENAKKSVEIAIEQGEDVAIKWLKGVEHNGAINK